jgi:hypothetical protein
METIGAKITLSTGLLVELQSDPQGNLAAVFSGGGLPAPILLPGTFQDMMKIARLLQIGAQLTQTQQMP